ncbi:hypothetical protein [Bacillus pumilus]|uniref:DUF4352 domain-containing protein n=1 Tax=Bacillus pumilus TaxID=1408 RepID=A0AB34QYL9_BACPU|nr:hypothetical protein [Bacillus pumilus]KIL23772.1 hypothetical protein B4127_2705 [Bacillus pumilus]
MGKRVLFSIYLSLIVLLVGCNSTKTVDETAEKPQEKTSHKKETKEDKTSTSYINEETGEILDLIKTQENIDPQNLGPLQIEFEGVNLSKLSKIPDDRLDDYQTMTEIPLKDPFNVISIKYSIENKGKDIINFVGISHLILDTKEQIKVNSNDLRTDQLETKIYGHAKKEVEIDVPIQSDASKIKSIRLVLESPLDENFSNVAETKELIVDLK